MLVCCNRASVCGSREPWRATFSATGLSASCRSSARKTRAKAPRPSSSTRRKPAIVCPASGKEDAGGGRRVEFRGLPRADQAVDVEAPGGGATPPRGIAPGIRRGRGPRPPPPAGRIPRRSGPPGRRGRAPGGDRDTTRPAPGRPPRDAGRGRSGAGPATRPGVRRGRSAGSRSGRDGGPGSRATPPRTDAPAGATPGTTPHPRSGPRRSGPRYRPSGWGRHGRSPPHEPDGITACPPTPGHLPSREEGGPAAALRLPDSSQTVTARRHGPRASERRPGPDIRSLVIGTSRSADRRATAGTPSGRGPRPP